MFDKSVAYNVHKTIYETFRWLRWPELPLERGGVRPDDGHLGGRRPVNFGSIGARQRRLLPEPVHAELSGDADVRQQWQSELDVQSRFVAKLRPSRMMAVVVTPFQMKIFILCLL